MTAPSPEYTDHVLEQLEPLGLVQASRFFGGVGISDGFTQFAMLMGDNLYFTVDDDTRNKYERVGMQPFSYMTKKGQVIVRKYFQVPDEVLADSEQLRLWANEAISAANRSKPKKASKRSPLRKPL